MLPLPRKIEAEPGEYGERPHAKWVVVQILGELKRLTRVTFPPRRPSRKDSAAGEPLLELRL